MSTMLIGSQMGARVRSRRGPGLLALWITRHQGRRRLAAMDDHLLADLGLSRAEALREARKPFWVA